MLLILLMLNTPSINIFQVCQAQNEKYKPKLILGNMFKVWDAITVNISVAVMPVRFHPMSNGWAWEITKSRMSVLIKSVGVARKITISETFYCSTVFNSDKFRC